MFDIKCKTEIHNYFEIEVLRDGKIREKAYAQNVVTDSFFSYLGDWYPSQLKLAVGDGEGEPSRLDKRLFHELETFGKKDDDIYWHNPNENIIALKKVFVIKPEKLVGEDLKEVGLKTYHGLLTHAMVKDSEGNDITVHKTEIDEITITAVIYYTVNLPSGVYLYNKRKVLNDDFLRGILSRISTETNISTKVNVEKLDKKRRISVRYNVDENNGESRSVFTSSFYFALKELKNFGGSKIIGKKIGVGDGSKKVYELGTTEAKKIKVYKNGILLPQESFSIIKEPILVKNSEITVLLKYATSEGVQENIKYKKIGSDLLFLVSSRGPSDYNNDNSFSILKRGVSTYKMLDILRIRDKYINKNIVKVFENQKAFTIDSDFYNIIDGKIEKTTKEECLGEGELSKVEDTYEDDFIKCENRDIKSKREKQIISFNTTPEDGDIITADFECDYIFKDSDHILDIVIDFDYSAGAGS